MGGVNLTALGLLEERAWGWYNFLVNSSTFLNASYPAKLAINTSLSGTQHGLAKWVYLRDTRRAAAGINGFRLAFNGTINYSNHSDPGRRFGFRFHDTVGLGNYNDDVHPLKSCKYPAYMASAGHGSKPFYLPLRALTVEGADNLLVAGKTMAQTFHANACTRVHPGEWASGVAAGGAASFMVDNKLSTTVELYNQVEELAAFLNSSAVGQPLDWAD